MSNAEIFGMFEPALEEVRRNDLLGARVSEPSLAMTDT